MEDMLKHSAAASFVPVSSQPIAPVVDPSGSGGDVVVEIGDYRYHVFKSVGTSTFSLSGSGYVNYLVVGGGGAGGNADVVPRRGGGGAGGVINSAVIMSPGSYSVTVGAATQNSQISSSVFFQLAYGEACGDGGGLNTGGYAPPYSQQGYPGGAGTSNASGGGGGVNEQGGAPRSSAWGGNGGDGTYVSWAAPLESAPGYNTSEDYYAGYPAGYYGGGGAGAGWNGVGGELGDAGLGGGGRDLTPYGQNGGDGYNNTGGAGRSGWSAIGLPARSGGSGVVILRYKFQ